MEAPVKLAIVCGMASEAAIVGEPPGAVVIVGAGDAAALSAKLEAAIAAGADRVISVGICGALDPSLRAGDIILGTLLIYQLAEVACDEVWTSRLYVALTAAPGLRVPYEDGGWFTTAPTAVARLSDKAALRKATTANVVDEETFIAGSIAAAHGLPFAAMRVVCDPADFELPPAALVKLTAAGSDDIGAIIASVAGDIWQIPELVELAGLSATSMGNLRAALARVGPNFGA